MIKKTINPLLCCIIMASFYCNGCLLENGIKGAVSTTLSANDWENYVGDGVGVWVSVDRQELLLIGNHRLIKRYRCSTAANGAGNKADSGMTPLGWHKIGAKIGCDLAAGAVLKDRQWTGEVWESGQDTNDDLILSRILRLEGLEEGINRGGDADTWSRYIYIHGTNQIDDLGRPASAGCIRLNPQEIIDLYERVDEGCCVLITVD